MCGILGKIFSISCSTTISEFDEALSLMEHRGPDDKGILKGDNFIFGQRRLSIIDLSKGGKQPMTSVDGMVTIIFNGEIYNYQEIKTNLISKGHHFKSSSDTEVLLHAYFEYGIECIHQLIGMFSFAVYDLRNNEAYIVRDRLGIKPLFYYHNNGNFTFSSEIKSILKLENEHTFEANESALSSYMSFRYPILNDTYFKEINSLPAGNLIHISQNGDLSIRRYWQFNDKLKEQEIDKGEEFYFNGIREILESAVKYRMIADVPIGSFLSGGVDSSAVTAIMAKNKAEPINTFTIGFEEEGYNEFAYANEVAEQYRTNHREIILSGNDYIQTMEKLIGYKDAPLSVPNEVPLYLMSKELKKYITVVLSGEGADEIFGGYGRIFRSPHDYEQFNKIQTEKYSEAEKSTFLKNFSERYGGKTFDTLLEHFYYLYTYTSVEDKQNLLLPNISGRTNENRLKEHFSKCFEEVKDESYYNKMMYSFERVHLQGLLNRVDMTTMAASVEARVPFVDHRLVEFAFTIPVKYKLKWNSEKDKFAARLLMGNEISENYDTPKYILKKAYEPMLSDNILYRKKMGFPVPLNSWFGGKFKDYAKEILLDQQTRDRGQFNTKGIEEWLGSPRMFKNHGFAMKIWMLINAELFNRKYF
jgi:asparagine synthase (glutamine-hydrolysing)